MPNEFSYPTKRKSWLRDIAPPAAGLGVLSLAAAIIPGQLGWGSSTTPPHHRHSTLHSVSIEWPAQGQAARPAPIASVAKVMTAYVVLRHEALSGDSDGFTMTLTAEDVALAEQDRADGQSYVAVESGETLTEREALDALLLPSANNIADALAEHVSGSVPAFVAEMNATASGLGMRHTTYTDPSGFDSSTVSTAADQLTLARAAMRIPAFAEIVRMPSAVLPVAGVVTNTDTVLGRDGFVGIKTGSDQAAGGCFMFEAIRRSHGHTWRITGVVLGQTGGPLIQAGLAAAQRLVADVIPQLRLTS